MKSSDGRGSIRPANGFLVGDTANPSLELAATIPAEFAGTWIVQQGIAEPDE